MDSVMDVSIRRITAPQSAPVTLAELKAHVHEDLDDATNNTYMTSLINAAVEWCEQYTLRSFITQDWTMTRQSFPVSDRIYLPRGPIQSNGILSVLYYDTAGVQQTWASSNYHLELIIHIRLNLIIVY